MSARSASLETSELLPNECSTPIRRASPPNHHHHHVTTSPLMSSGALGISIPPSRGRPTEPPSSPSAKTPTYLGSQPVTPARTANGGGGVSANSSRFNSTRLDPRMAATLSFSPEQRSRRLSNASVVRSRSVADFHDDGGKLTRSRALALVAVCLLSVGSHFTMYLMGPLKSRLHRELGSSNSQFSLLISALNLNSTWTPLVGGILVSRFGTGWSSVVTTGAVLLGEIIVYFGVTHGNLVTMAGGFFLFGLGMTPLMVVQETLLAKLSPGGHLGLSLALGLVSGKFASFIAAMCSLPLAEAGGDGMPFFVALVLCATSFIANILRLTFRWGETDEAERVAPRRIVKWDGISRLGDVYYVFIVMNILCGAIWSPFLHLSANIVQVRFSLSESQASFNASVLLAGAIILYPITGYITDRHGSDTPRTTFQLFHITCILTLFGYIYLALPVSLTQTPWPGLISWALGHGASPLLLVVMVARILPVALVPLGLGMHKAMESAASTASQTLAGLWLDWAKDHRGGQDNAAHGLLVIFAVVNVLQILSAGGLWKFESARRTALSHRPSGLHDHADEYERLPLAADAEQGGAGGLGLRAAASARSSLSDDDYENDSNDDDARSASSFDDCLPAAKGEVEEPQTGLARTDAERARGKTSFRICLCFLVSVWVLFIATAWRKL